MSHKRLPGRMDGDFSKIQVDGEGRDSAVRLLQGRVILDSDWNLQAEIFTRRRRRGFADLIGPAGAPAQSAGFGLVAESQLRFDGESSVVVIGGDGVDVWGSKVGACLELIFTPSPGRGGVLLGRFSRRADGGFGHDLSLVLEADGRLVAHAEGVSLEAPMPARWGRRNHVALSWRPGDARWWVNGHSASTSAELPLHRAATVAVLGATLRGGEVTQAYAGGLHEVRFWSEARTDAQIHAESGPGAPDASSSALAGWWHFDRPSPGLEVPDRARHGVPAVLGGGRADRAPRRHGDRLRVTPGRFWVEGMLCQRAKVEVL
ncbi:MAG: LamG-like jellyroll fold domain-containing protein, partial [Acidobacteriota bacterium]